MSTILTEAICTMEGCEIQLGFKEEKLSFGLVHTAYGLLVNDPPEIPEPTNISLRLEEIQDEEIRADYEDAIYTLFMAGLENVFDDTESVRKLIVMCNPDQIALPNRFPADIILQDQTPFDCDFRIEAKLIHAMYKTSFSGKSSELLLFIAWNSESPSYWVNEKKEPPKEYLKYLKENS
jgi:hypothetical protein